MRLTDHSARSAPTACWDGLRGTVRCSSVAAVEQALPKSRARAGGHGIVLILRACDWSKSLDFIGLWARVHCRIVVLKSAKSRKDCGGLAPAPSLADECRSSHGAKPRLQAQAARSKATCRSKAILTIFRSVHVLRQSHMSTRRGEVDAPLPTSRSVTGSPP